MSLVNDFTAVVLAGLKGPELNAFVARLKEADEELQFLYALEAVGVDNWSGYELAQEMMGSEDDSDD